MKLRYWGMFTLAVSVILDGKCVKWDGELCDNDPFNLDNLFESHKTTGPSKRPAVKPSPRPQVKVTKRR